VTFVGTLFANPDVLEMGTAGFCSNEFGSNDFQSSLGILFEMFTGTKLPT
jgi:hypothetical protein